MHWVAWDKVIAPKDKGGLGVGSIYALNIGLLVKWWWRLKTQPSALWCKIIGEIHKLPGKPPDQLADSRINGTWKNIANVKNDISKLNLNFHNIFTLQAVPNGERWRCLINHNGPYTVESLRSRVDQSQYIESPQLVSWRKDIPIKVIGFVWKAAQGSIASSVALSSRGVPVSSMACRRCGDPEDADHILLSCPFAAHVRKEISDWCGVSIPHFNEVKQILDFGMHWGRCPKKRRLLLMVIYGMLWRLWICRNDKIFKGRHVSVSWARDDIKSTIFLWVNHRAFFGTCNWLNWQVSPFTCL